MTRKFYNLLLLAAAFLPFALTAQMDTLLFEDFQDDIIGDVEEELAIFPQGDDTTWVNYDADYIPDFNNRPQSWYTSVDFAQGTQDSIAPADTAIVLASSSWLSGFLDGNRNWLITPPIDIGDDQATLHWKSAPYQGPRYVDGYSVLVSTSMNFPESFTDTLFRAQQMIPPLPPGAEDPNGGAFDVESFLFAPENGYLHADGYTLQEYFFLDAPDDNLWIGILEPHSVDLAAYSGKSIYIAFVHDSDDDNLISIDDILVMGNLLSSTQEPLAADIRLVTYPNPVDNQLNVLFRLETPAQVRTSLYDMNGKQVLSMASEGRLLGEQSLKLDLRRLPAGAYNLVLDVEGQQYARKVVKR
ncbi:MAG: T9SS type A sorting domain-containing protein [Lewinellaceae bacterium]|nr:T9SS type A sorting domain-containing protein [Phaeodactylibacter sp.]MCB9041877.1 T9SS type A sorting domain-containing protein [Lewinellaceae bacterium]